MSAIERAAADADLHSVLVWQSGRMRLEHYRRSKDQPVGDWFAREVTFGPDVLHDLRSISKSVVALLVGQAVGRGQIAGFAKPSSFPIDCGTQAVLAVPQ